MSDVCPFAGVWKGGWYTETQASGSWTMHISADGSVSGTATGDSSEQSATLSGTVTPDGVYHYVYRYHPTERNGNGSMHRVNADALAVSWRDYENGFIVVMGSANSSDNPTTHRDTSPVLLLATAAR